MKFKCIACERTYRFCPPDRPRYPGRCPVCRVSYDNEKSVIESILDAMEDAHNWKCSLCGEPCDPADPNWTWEGEAWEHRHAGGAVVAVYKNEQREGSKR